MSQMASGASTRPRKASTYGGSRAWSEEEESFLLDSRSRKTPYKAIAQYLQKTELACRLHYHQLAYGTKRKRRGTSTSSVSTSIGSNSVSLTSTTRGHTPQKSIDSSSSYLSPQPPAIALPDISPPHSPPISRGSRLARSESPQGNLQLRVPSMHVAPATSTIPSSDQFLPFPQLLRTDLSLSQSPDLQRRHSSCSLGPLRRDSSCSNTYLNDPLPCLSDQRGRPDFFFTNSRSTAVLPDFTGVADQCNIDLTRLIHCYKAHRHTFWNIVARDYGGTVSPLELEAAFLRQHAVSPVNSLPTPPSRSPVLLPVVMAEDVDADASRHSSTTGQNSGESKNASGGSCSIASILNEDQEVWSVRRQTV